MVVPGQLLGFVKWRPVYVDGIVWVHYNTYLDNPLRFVHAAKPLTLTPPEGFTFDMASIPSWAWPLMGPPTGYGSESRHGPAACLHDYGARHQRWDQGVWLTREENDAIFKAALYDLGVSEWRVRVMYTAVRLGGARGWRENRRKLVQQGLCPPPA